MGSCQALGWMLWKDIKTELRGKQTWFGMVLMGITLVLFLEMQLDLPLALKSSIVSGLFWLDVFFVGILALDRSMASEREDGNLRMLLLFPRHPGVIYLGKVILNVVAITLMELILLPAFAVFSNVSLVERPLHLALIILLGNLGFSAVGVMVSAMTSSLNQRGSLLALLLLPLIIPVLLGSAEGTRLLLYGEADSVWWSWVQLLSIFSLIFILIGFCSFGLIVEE